MPLPGGWLAESLESAVSVKEKSSDLTGAEKHHNIRFFRSDCDSAESYGNCVLFHSTHSLRKKMVYIESAIPLVRPPTTGETSTSKLICCNQLQYG